MTVTLSTPSLGITELLIRITVTPRKSHFQLPLSGSLLQYDPRWIDVIFDEKLSTPSLGITSAEEEDEIAEWVWLSTPSLGITFAAASNVKLNLANFQLPLSGSL